MLSLNTNMMALVASRFLAQTESALAVTRARLSSGLRINSARDDAAGLAISERLMAQIRGTDVAARNANAAISMAQIADNAVGAVVEALQDMYELAAEAQDPTLTASQLSSLQNRFAQYRSDVASLVGNTEYDGIKLLDNSVPSLTLHIGPDAGQSITVTPAGLSALNTSIQTLNLTADAAGAYAALPTHLDTATGVQAEWAAVQNRFDRVLSQLESSSSILTVARGRIVDADMAAEAASLARLLVLQDSAAAMLAQANVHHRKLVSLLLG